MNSIIKHKEEHIISIVLGVFTFALVMWNLLQRTYSLNEDFIMIRNRYIFSMFLFVVIMHLVELGKEIVFLIRVNKAHFKLSYNNSKLIIAISFCCIASIIGAFIAFNNGKLILGYIILFIAWNLFPRFNTNGIYTSSEGIIVSNIFVSNNRIKQIELIKKNKYKIVYDSEEIVIKIYDKGKLNWINNYMALSRSTIDYS